MMSLAEATRIRNQRWYDQVAIDNFRKFVHGYIFGFTPKHAINISASPVCPLNDALLEKYMDIKITNTYQGEVDIKQMPYADDSIDILMSKMVLEHVSHVWEAPAEIYRVLREGGITIQLVPFMYPEHGVGSDYLRFTRTGLGDLFNQFEVLQLGCSGHQEISNFLMKYRSNHPRLRLFENEKSAAEKIRNDVGDGKIGNLCSNTVWGYFRKGERAK